MSKKIFLRSFFQDMRLCYQHSRFTPIVLHESSITAYISEHDGYDFVFGG